MLLVAAATDPLTRKKRSGDVLLVGGLALGYLTSEVRARQRKGHFLWSEPRGLDETLGWRESVPGEGVAPQGGESLPAAGEELGAARSGNTEQLLGSSAFRGRLHFGVYLWDRLAGCSRRVQDHPRGSVLRTAGHCVLQGHLCEHSWEMSLLTLNIRKSCSPKYLVFICEHRVLH